MTERKPPGLGFESWIDKQVREAEERGEFENLPGAGKPLPGAGEPYDENWWLHAKLRRENIDTGALLPVSLQLRKEIGQLADMVRQLPSEQAVRDAVSDLNGRIAAWLRAPSEPFVPLRPVSVPELLAEWRAARSMSTVEPKAAAVPPRTRWWRRRSG